MLLTRSSMLETLREDYILTARAKGLTERAIRDNHAARNALLPGGDVPGAGSLVRDRRRDPHRSASSPGRVLARCC